MDGENSFMRNELDLDDDAYNFGSDDDEWLPSSDYDDARDDE